MLLIVAHHYIMNSGLMAADGPIYSNFFSLHSVFLLLMGAWGKTGINCFVLFSGYFMCKSAISARKFVKLIGECLFYNYIIFIIFLIFGYEHITLKSVFYLVVPVNSLSDNFVATYIVFYLCIPFLNILVQKMTERQHVKLLLLCSFSYVLLGTFHRITMNYVSWFIVLYFISSYIRLYPKKLYANGRFWGIMLCISVILSVLSVLVCTWLAANYGVGSPYYFMQDSNTFLALTNGLCGFMYFKNLKISYSRTINTIAASTFGVLLIHAGSDAMRQWLWKDTLNNVNAYYHTWGYAHIILSVLGIFTICTILDIMRIKLIEKPFLGLWDRKSDRISNRYKAIENAICSRLNIK